MKNFIGKFVSFVMAMAVSVGAFAQNPEQVDVIPAQTPQPCCSSDKFKMNLDASVTMYDFSDGTVVEVNPEFSVELFEYLKVGTYLSVYNDSNSYFDPRQLAWSLNSGAGNPSGTGFGDIGFYTTYNLFDGKFDPIPVDRTWVNLTAGFAIPLDGAYSSDDTVYYIGGIVGLELDAFSLSHSCKYSFVDNYTYVAAFGDFAQDDVYNGITSITWKAKEDLSVSFNFTHYQSGDYNLVLAGPSVKYDFSSTTSFNASIGIPIDNDVPGGDLDAAFSAGVGLEF